MLARETVVEQRFVEKLSRTADEWTSRRVLIISRPFTDQDER
jgi:hypothetical protein